MFGLYDRAGAKGPVTSAETGATKQAEVILEYHYPTTHTSQDWATRFHNLSTLSLADVPETIAVTTSRSSPPDLTDFGVALQGITDLVTEMGAQPAAPNNGSSIGQIRTLENVFSSTTLNPPWEFRQFQFLPSCTGTACQLTEVQLPQAPLISANPPLLISMGQHRRRLNRSYRTSSSTIRTRFRDRFMWCRTRCLPVPWFSSPPMTRVSGHTRAR